MVFEVFRQERKGQPFQHAGSVTAPDETFAETTVQLAPGDRMVVFTDGIEVAFSDDATADSVRWRDELWLRRGLSSEELLRDFAAHVDKQLGSLSPKDDLTMIVVEVEK